MKRIIWAWPHIAGAAAGTNSRRTVDGYCTAARQVQRRYKTTGPIIRVGPTAVSDKGVIVAKTVDAIKMKNRHANARKAILIS